MKLRIFFDGQIATLNLLLLPLQNVFEFRKFLGAGVRCCACREQT